MANPNQLYFNSLVKTSCHETPYRCPHRLNLSSRSSRSCAWPNIKMLKDKDLEFANSIRSFGNPDTVSRLADHVSAVGQAALSALARCGRASASAARPRAAPRHLRGSGLGERDALHHVGDAAPLLSPASYLTGCKFCELV